MRGLVIVGQIWVHLSKAAAGIIEIELRNSGNSVAYCKWLLSSFI